jgi:hypothetical protein
LKDLDNNSAKLKRDIKSNTQLGEPEGYVGCWIYVLDLLAESVMISAPGELTMLISTVEETLIWNSSYMFWKCVGFLPGVFDLQVGVEQAYFP